MKLNLNILLLLNLICTLSFANTNKLDSLIQQKSKEISSLNVRVNISLSDVELDALVWAIAKAANANIHINGKLDKVVTNNFSDVPLKDVLIYLAGVYELDISFIGNIIIITAKDEPPTTYDKNFRWNSSASLLSLNFENLPARVVAREITKITGKNVVLGNNMGGRGSEENTLSAYIEQMPFEAALDKLAYSNGLTSKKTEDNFYILEKSKATAPSNQEQTSRTNTRSRSSSRLTPGSSGNNQKTVANESDFKLNIKQNQDGSINVLADAVPIDTLVKELCKVTKANYVISGEIADLVTLKIDNIEFESLLDEVFLETESTYIVENNLYIFGALEDDFNKITRIIPLKYRQLHGVVDTLIPEYIKEGIHFKHYYDLNSLIATGRKDKIDRLEEYIQLVDRTIPVVKIEVAIISISESFSISTGVEMGLSSEPVNSSGSVLPGIDLTITSSQLTKILNNIGFKNLGNLSPDFYLKLEALENQGFLDVKSTSTLSALNGNTATMSIGEETYYLIEEINITGTQNPQVTNSTRYEAVTADLSVTITPIVSANEYITLDITVTQSDFTDRISPTAPPGSVIREFTSKVRVKNQETIMLGGLEERKKSDSGQGTPILSRIPVIKWFFSSRIKEDSDSKLTVLIKPTIIN